MIQYGTCKQKICQFHRENYQLSFPNQIILCTIFCFEIVGFIFNFEILFMMFPCDIIPGEPYEIRYLKVNDPCLMFLLAREREKIRK